MAHLIGDRIILREFRESDYERVHHWVNNEKYYKVYINKHILSNREADKRIYG